MASESVNKRAVRDYLRARETRDLDPLDNVVAPSFRHEMLGREQDRAGLFHEVANFPFSEATFEIDALVEKDDRVACRYRFRGKAPNGQPAAFSGMFIAVLNNGQLISGWGSTTPRRRSTACTRRSSWEIQPA